MMNTKFLFPLVILLAGCTTTVTVTKPYFPNPPAELVVAPKEPVALKDADPKTALQLISSNDILLRQDEEQLKALIDWIKKTSESINNPK